MRRCIEWKRSGSCLGVLALALLGIAGCGSSESSIEVEIYESDDPGAQPDPYGGDIWGDVVDESGADGNVDDDIVEADIVQIRDDRLYAFSKTGGLHIIDLSKKDRLEILGRFRVVQPAMPFELYLRGDVAFAMYSDEGHWVTDPETGKQRMVQESLLLALDVSDPRNIREIGRFEIAGAIADSRIVGDVLYVVSHRNPICYGCNEKPKTVVVSLDVGDPTSIRRVDELAFEAFRSSDGWERPSVTVTPTRMYVASPEWISDSSRASTIQVIDIEDRHGDLELGASVQTAGTVSSRWQMDEHDGVLRVVSQDPESWTIDKPPRVETFRIVSSDELQPLGSLDLTLPRPEELRSVRFDGTRAYAVTFERIDPIFTIDLSNPEAPEQKGELEIPGWVHHMEPRGDRLFGFGFDPSSGEGSLHVSIFDVSDLAKPTMLDRVNFGPHWDSGYREDRNRIHKTVQLLPEEGLIVVPYAGSGAWEGCSGRVSGVQLIDVDGDTLTKRGVVPARGARRAVLHENRLVAFADNRAQLFDIENRSKPKSLATAHISRTVYELLPVGDHLVRVVDVGDSGTTALQVVPENDPNVDEPIGSVELVRDPTGEACGAYHFGNARFFAHESWVYVLVPSEVSSQRGTLVYVVDFRDPKKPKVVHESELPFMFATSDDTGQSWRSSFIEAGAHAVQKGSTVAVIETVYRHSESARRGVVHVLDFASPVAPRHKAIQLPKAEGRTALHLHGSELFVGRWNAIPEKPSRVRFYLDRIVLASPEPYALPSVNVPGSLLAYDVESGFLLTVDYRRETRPAESWDECREGTRDHQQGLCQIVHRSVELLTLDPNQGAVRLDSAQLDDGLRIQRVALGRDRVYLFEEKPWDGYCGFNLCETSGPKRLRVISGAREGKLRVTSADVTTLGYEDGLTAVLPVDQRLIVSGTLTASAGVFDARDLGRPTTTPIGEVWGYAHDVVLRNGRVFFALGSDEIRSTRLPD